MSSINDIENEIYKAISFVGTDDSGVLKGILNSNPEMLEDVKVGGLGFAVQFGLNKLKQKKLDKSKSLVFCFDDLERWNGDLNVCLSYINKLVEHDGSKCIVLGNSEQLDDNVKSKLNISKEKVIRYQYKMKTDSSHIFRIAITNSGFDDEQLDYLKPLIESNIARLSNLLDVINFGNIRVIIDSIQLFSQVYLRNREVFQGSPALSISYYETLLAALILVTRYVKDEEDREQILNYGISEKERYRFLSEIGFFDEEAPDGIENERKKLLEKVFHVEDEIPLNTIFSIIKNGFYIDSDFDLVFDKWTPSKEYEYYLDTFSFWYMDDNEADRVFRETEVQIFEDKIVNNPIKLLKFTDRLTQDIKRGVLNCDYDEYRRKVISLFEDLYSSEKMERVKYLDIYDSFKPMAYCRDIAVLVKEMNDEYLRKLSEKVNESFWRDLKNEPDNYDELIHAHQKEPVFSFYTDSSEVIGALNSLNNGQLFEFTRWMGSRIESCIRAVEDEKVKALMVADAIDKEYEEAFSIRAGHFKQISRVIRNNRTDYDPEFIDSMKS